MSSGDFCASPESGSEDESAPNKIEKIKAIINREFQNEINHRRQCLDTIDDRLLEARKVFHRLRYAVVHDFYNPKKFELSNDDVQKEISDQTDPDRKTEVYSVLIDEQKRIHPAVKSVLSEKPTDEAYDVTARSLRRRPKPDEIKTSECEKIEPDCGDDDEKPSKSIHLLDAIKDAESGDKKENKTEIKIPMYVGPKGLNDNVLKIDFRSRNKQREKFRIIIGNTSKYIEPYSAQDRTTHKWLLYVRGPPLDPDISSIVDSVMVKLHDSYIPHNIVKIKSPPFHLSRRGWGEFPVKLKIYFKNEKLNKPINVVHNLKLDPLCTGLQTLGAETVIDVWLYTDKNAISRINGENNENENEIKYPQIDEIKPANDVDDFQCKIENNEVHDDDSSVKIKEEPMDVDDENNYEEVYSDNFTFENDSCYINGACDNLNSFIMDENNDSDSNNYAFRYSTSFDSVSGTETRNKYIEHDHTYASKQNSNKNIDITTHVQCAVESKTLFEILQKVEAQQIVEWFNSFDLNIGLMDSSEFNIRKIIEFNRSILDKIVNCNLVLNKKKIFNIQNIATVNRIILSCYMKELATSFWKSNDRLPNKVTGFVEILKEINSFNETFSSIQGALIKNLQIKSSEDGKNFDTGAMKRAVGILEEMIGNIHKISNIRSFISMMLNKMPLVHECAKAVEFQQLFPYVVESSEAYFSLNKIKRRNLQWTRAKMIHEFVKNFCRDKFTDVWSTKQILVFAQCHGYYPVNDNDASVNFSNSGNCIDPMEKFESSHDINTKTVCDFSYDKTFMNDNKTPKNETCYEFCYISDSSDDEVDVCNDDDDDNDKTVNTSDIDNNKTPLLKVESEILPFENDDEKILCKYIENVCADLGIVITNQNVGHGYVFGIVHKLILSAMKNFIEDILRRSLAVKMANIYSLTSYNNDNNDEDSEYTGQNNLVMNLEENKNKRKIWKMSESCTSTNVSLRHVFEALKSRREFDFLTNFGLGSEMSTFTGGL